MVWFTNIHESVQQGEVLLSMATSSSFTVTWLEPESISGCKWALAKPPTGMSSR